MTSIDHTAPVTAQASAHAPVEPERVWAVLADIAGWEAVYPEIKDVHLDGPVEIGATFSFRSGPGRIQATLTDLEPPHLLAITGKGMGATTRYVFRLEPEAGGTRITAEQSMSGAAARTMRPMLQSIADRSLSDWVASLASHRTEAGA
jgi:carbon monoxide dehydrogenase subunit G